MRCAGRFSGRIEQHHPTAGLYPRRLIQGRLPLALDGIAYGIRGAQWARSGGPTQHPDGCSAANDRSWLIWR